MPWVCAPSWLRAHLEPAQPSVTPSHWSRGDRLPDIAVQRPGPTSACGSCFQQRIPCLLPAWATACLCPSPALPGTLPSSTHPQVHIPAWPQGGAQCLGLPPDAQAPCSLAGAGPDLTQLPWGGRSCCSCPRHQKLPCSQTCNSPSIHVLIWF